MKPGSSISRRRFLAASASTVGAVTGSARTQESAPAPPRIGAGDRLHVGIIGCGGMGEAHLGALLEMGATENVAVTAVADIYETRARRFAERVAAAGGQAQAFSSHQALVESADVDYVVVATPEHSHHLVTLDALAAGKHVYCEKPLTHTIAEAQAVVEAVRRTGLKLQVGVQGMSDDSYDRACEVIRAGRIGPVVAAQIEYVRHYERHPGAMRAEIDPRSPRPADLDWEAWLKPAPARPWDPRRYHDWRCYRDYSGGIASDLFIHRLTRLMKALGFTFPRRVAGMGGIFIWPDGRDLPDNFEMLLEYPPIEGVSPGLTVHLLGTMSNHHRYDHCIRGQDGTLVFSPHQGWDFEGWKILDPAGREVQRHVRTGGEDVGLHHRNLQAAIRHNAALNCPVELGLYGVAAVCMGNQSWFDGRMYGWDAASRKAVPIEHLTPAIPETAPA